MTASCRSALQQSQARAPAVLGATHPVVLPMSGGLEYAGGSGEDMGFHIGSYSMRSLHVEYVSDGSVIVNGQETRLLAVQVN